MHFQSNPDGFLNFSLSPIPAKSDDEKVQNKQCLLLSDIYTQTFTLRSSSKPYPIIQNTRWFSKTAKEIIHIADDRDSVIPHRPQGCHPEVS